jgi:Domain of unknown function DUF29
MSDLYERDFYQWTVEQGELLRARRLDETDIGNLAEEIESVGRGLQRELGDRLSDLLRYMLRWQYQIEGRTQDLQSALSEQRVWINGLLEQSPSLQDFISDEFNNHSYKLARILAARDMGVEVSTFPEPCPWAFEQMMAFDIRL